MVTKLILEDGGLRQHRPRLQSLLRASTGTVRIASAYVTESDLLLDHVKNRKVRLLTSLSRMDIAAGATSLVCLKLLIQSGVEVRHLTEQARFHAKVYLFGSESGIVTSANLTQSAFDRNIEVGAELSGETVQQLATWFDHHWKRAQPFGIKALDKLALETAALRREFAKLRSKAKATPGQTATGLMDGTNSQSSKQLQTFLCNSDRAHSDSNAIGDVELEELMRTSNYALAWEPFRWRDQMKLVREKDVVLIYANKLGIIGIGEATGECEIIPANSNDQIRKYPEPEWRIPVNWLHWDRNRPCQWTPHFVGTFLDVSSDHYRARREAVRKFVARLTSSADSPVQ
jgi:hypothetical protein